MLLLQNETLSVELDERWPRISKMARRDSPASLSGCDPMQPFLMELNGVRYGQEVLTASVRAMAAQADYVVSIGSLALTVHFRVALDGQEIVLTVPDVREEGEFRLETLYLPEHRLVTGLAVSGDRYLRHITRRINWSRRWCPGTATYNQWEDTGAVGGAGPEPGPQLTNHGCIWNDGLCAAVDCSIRVEPLVTWLEAAGQTQKGRAGSFSLWAGCWSYRLRGALAEPLAVRIALLGDYNSNGRIDWCDAAAWEGDRRLRPRCPLRRGACLQAHAGSPGPGNAVSNICPVSGRYSADAPHFRRPETDRLSGRLAAHRP